MRAAAGGEQIRPIKAVKFIDQRNPLQSGKFKEYPTSSLFLLSQLHVYTQSLLCELETHLDHRFVKTFFDLLAAILINRNSKMTLLLSELGGYIAGFRHAPAGTKRISNLLRCDKWQHTLIDQWLFDRMIKNCKEMLLKGNRPLFIWDDSVVEKHESRLLQGLCSVFSSKGQRLTKIRRGFYQPPKGRICVPGFKWRGMIVSHLNAIPQVGAMTWWTTRGKFKSPENENLLYCTLRDVYKHLGRIGLHILDRGFATINTLQLFADMKQDLLVRWRTGFYLTHEEKGRKKTHLLARSFKGKGRKIIQDKERKITRHISIAFTKVQRQEVENQSYTLIIIRDVNGKFKPIYLLTSLEIMDIKTAWEMCFSYMHRWEIEQSFRFIKSELGLESARLWFFENRLKLMAVATLVYDFILRMLRGFWDSCQAILTRWCHRTGSRYRQASIPAYRIRAAFANALCCFVFANSS